MLRRSPLRTPPLGLLFAWVTALSALPGEAGEVLQLRRCEVDYERTSQISASFDAGENTTVIQDCLVKEGDRVKVGQVLGRLVDKALRAILEQRTAEAENVLDVQYAENKLELATVELRRSEVLCKRGACSLEQYQIDQIEARAAALEVKQAKYRRQQAEYQRRVTEALLRNREFVAPHDGVVVEIVKKQGDSVIQNEEIFRLVSIDRMKVTGYLDVGGAYQVRPGQRVRVYPDVVGADLPIEREVFPGRIAFVESRIDPVSGTCKVIAEVENRDLKLKSGIEARMEIELDEGPREAASRPPVNADQ